MSAGWGSVGAAVGAVTGNVGLWVPIGVTMGAGVRIALAAAFGQAGKK